jgi:hypothetical protein
LSLQAKSSLQDPQKDLDAFMINIDKR